MERNRDERQIFTEGSIPKKLIGFMLPVFAAMVLQDVYGAVDLLVVGRFGTTAGISGVSIGSNVMRFVTILFAALTTAVTVLLGRNIGAGEREKNGELIGNSVTFFTLCAAVVSGLLVILARQIAALMQTPEESITETAQYIRICGGGFIFVVLYNYISAIFRGLGNSRLPLLFVGIACVINIFGDLLLVAVFHLNVVGAAVATIAAQAISVILSLIIIRRQDLGFKIERKHLRPGKQVGSILRIGTPLALQDTLTNVTFLAICAFVNRLGLECSSGYGIAQKVTSFVMLIPSSLMLSMAPFVSQNVGAGLERRASRAMLTGMLLGGGIGVPIFILAIFRGDLLAGLFTSDAAVVARAFEYLRGFAPEAVVTSILFSFLGYFNGHQESRFILAQGMIQSFLIRLPMSYLMSIRPDASLTGIGLAAPTATTFGILMCCWYYVRLGKRLDRSK